jgi:hypothetical protein
MFFHPSTSWLQDFSFTTRGLPVTTLILNLCTVGYVSGTKLDHAGYHE